MTHFMTDDSACLGSGFQDVTRPAFRCGWAVVHCGYVQLLLQLSEWNTGLLHRSAFCMVWL